MKLSRNGINRLLCCILILMLPFSWVNISIGSVYRLVTLLVFTIYLINNRFKIQIAQESRSVFVIWTIYAAFAILTTLWAQNAESANNNAMGTVLLYMISLPFLGVTYNAITKRYLQICWVCVTVFLTIMFIFGETSNIDYAGRQSLVIFGTLTDANEFSSIFIVGLTVIVNLFLKVKGKFCKALLILLSVLNIYIVLMTASRGAFLSLGIAVLLTLLNSVKKIDIKKIFFSLVILFVVLVVIDVLILPMIPESNLDRFMLGTIFDDKGSGRLIIWASALNYFVKGNVLRMIIGYGYGRFAVSTLYGDANMVLHNQFLQHLVSYGFVGLGLYTALIWRCWLAFRSHLKEYYGAFIGIVIMSLTLTMGASYKILWIVLFMAMMRKDQEAA